MPIKGYNNSQYFIIFICDQFKLLKIYIIKSQREIFNYLIYFKKYYKRLNLSQTIKRLRFDGVVKYLLNKLKNYCVKEGIVIKTIELYILEINSPSKRLSQTIYYKAALILKHFRLNLKFQPKAVKYTVYLYLYSLYLKLKKTPFKAQNNKQPYIKYIYTFSSIIYYYNSKKLKKFI